MIAINKNDPEQTSINKTNPVLNNTETRQEEPVPDRDKDNIDNNNKTEEPAEPEPVIVETEIDNEQDDKPEPSAQNQSQENSPVAIDNFKCSYKTGRDFLDIKFNIKNNSPDSDSVSGHAVVVLKDKNNNHRKWIALPDDIKLVSGRPTGEDMGQTFSISFFKTLHFRAKEINPEQFKTAGIYIFSREGELMLEQDQAIIIDQDN